MSDGEGNEVFMVNDDEVVNKEDDDSLNLLMFHGLGKCRCSDDGCDKFH